MLRNYTACVGWCIKA